MVSPGGNTTIGSSTGGVHLTRCLSPLLSYQIPSPGVPIVSPGGNGTTGGTSSIGGQSSPPPGGISGSFIAIGSNIPRTFNIP